MKLTSRCSRGDVVVIMMCLCWAALCAGSVGGRGASFAKRAICLANMKRLTCAWLAWTHDNDGSIPPGGGLIGGTIGQPADVTGGALWPYCQDVDLYQCPNGFSGEAVTYCIVESMIGRKPAGGGGHYVSKLSDLPESARPARMVFIDVGRACFDSFRVHYDRHQWWDAAPVRHDCGTCVSFADGHSEYWRWEDPRTIQTARPPQTPFPPAGYNQDLIRLQKAVWGELAYSVP